MPETSPDVASSQTTSPACISPSVLCPQSSVCISQSQFCNGQKDCPDSYDEQNCVRRCPSKSDFRCKDRRRCISKNLVCDGRAHCYDSSDEINCPAITYPSTPVNILKCRRGSTPCNDGTECILVSHVCDGEVDCRDGSDEEGCINEDLKVPSDVSETPQVTPAVTIPQTSTLPACISPSVLCPQSPICITSSDFRCKDRLSCVPRNLVCDGRSHCQDGSDEMNCPTVAPATTLQSALKCHLGSRLCQNGKECVLISHVCDGENDCQDGSDEVGCTEEVTSTVPPTTPSGDVPLTTVSFTPPRMNFLRCRKGAKPCSDGTECVLLIHLCDGENDCLDGSDEQGCPEICKEGEFQCAHGKMCLPQSQVCDGKAQCLDHSDELNCWEPMKSCEHHCPDGKRCIPKKFLCDGERDCLDGSDEMGCSSSLCISDTQLCDGQKDCPDGFDEDNCITACRNPGDFLCKDRRKCISREQVCDGRYHCADSSDEMQCQSEDATDPPLLPPPKASVDVFGVRTSPLKCRKGSKLCADGRGCVLYSHVCDGEMDCQDGSDEKGCASQCKDEFQCSHGSKCVPREQVCDGRYDCQDRSDELNCEKRVEGCSHLCDNNTRCIPETFLCDGEVDCADGTDEEKCGSVICPDGYYHCASGQCIFEALRCDGHADCFDRSDEVGCRKPPHCPTELQCPHSHECLQKEWLCDGEEDCKDGSDEKKCLMPPAKCREFQWQCGDSSQCIPVSWRCDGKMDCDNGLDENKCKKMKCPPHLYSCGSGECVNPTLVCNGVSNCVDGSDEGVGCTQSNCSSLSAPQCEDTCVSTPNGPRCSCAAGFRLQSNRVSCEDVDECNETPLQVCKHICINSRGSYTCFCHLGFYLEPDNKSCKTKDEPLLLASVQSELLLLGVHSGTLSLLSSASRPVFALDFHWSQQRVYWLSPVYQTIRWADMKNANKGTLIKGVKSDSIAVDWVGNNLYWVDGLMGQILAVKLSDAIVRPQDYTVVLGDAVEQLRSLILLPHRGLMLWSEISSTPQIKQAGMDGSNRKVLVSSGLRWPVGLAFDLLDNRVYWADEKLRCIGSASMDGDNVKILQLAETPSPFSVGVFNDRVFWSDTKKRTIRSAEKNTGKRQKVLLKRPGQPFGLKLMHALSQPDMSNPCNQLHCSHLCLLAPTLRGNSAEPGMPAGVCRCPPGLLLSQNKTTCSLPEDTSFILFLSQTTVTLTYLQSIHRDIVGLKKLPNGRDLALPSGTEASKLEVSVHGGFMYVADAQGSISILMLNGSRSELSLTLAGQIVKLEDDHVMALALDWVTSNLYWTSTGRPDLHVTSPKGYATSLLQGSLKSTTSIAVHPPSGQLCYTVLGVTNGKNPAQVECAYMDGRNQEVLWKKSTAPSSLIFSKEGTRVYWADSGEGTISSVGLDGSGYKQFQAGPGLLVSFTLTENILLWVTLSNDVTKLWFTDGLQPKQMWFETKSSIIEVKAYSNNSQSGRIDSLSCRLGTVETCSALGKDSDEWSSVSQHSLC
ncbi:low-density lipoprotein receptor-related protein 2-like [Thalassophryne amazonica]|uniref:low-density lipoprotein receptor-related protein 2-like n=1 Tax=Thalassophryne amazonica TaxID=390379 RepID=UPI001470F32D|nr:low-density lipoprotein receptor-related protein 2-like [Thalassophryne amazonica]